MDVVQRVRNIVLRPREEWVTINGEPTGPRELFVSYAMILAAIPFAAEFLRLVLIGQRGLPFVKVLRWSVGRALGYAIVGYVFSLAAVYIFGLVIDALAPSFSSTPNMTKALKLAVYSMTPGWVAGVLNLIPGTAWLVVLASLYGLYILYAGLDAPLMDTPKDKVPGYLGASILVVIVLAVVVGLLRGIFAIRYHA